MTGPTGTLMWTLNDQPSRRAPSAYSTECYIDRMADQWVVLVIRGPETVTSETCDSEENAGMRARALRSAIQRQTP